MSYLWVWLEFFSALPVFFARFVLPRITGRVVVAERCPVDFLVWLAVTLRRNVFKSFIGRATLSIAFSLCECMVYVRADEGVLLSRRSALWDRRVIPVELRIYDSLARFLGVRVVDTSGKSVEESLREVVEIAGNECV
ncbi:hypothetical protein [Desulfurococcus mucosus]|nr:hypothetical protein [Desulfurococcus mucosus]